MGVLVALLIWHVNRQRAAQPGWPSCARSSACGRTTARSPPVRLARGAHPADDRPRLPRIDPRRRDDEATSGDAELVLAEVDKASALTTQVLTLVRVEASRRAPVDLSTSTSCSTACAGAGPRVNRHWARSAVSAWSSGTRSGSRRRWTA